MDEEIKEQQKGAETLEIAKTVFNPQVAQFVPSADTCYEFSVHPDLMSHIIGINGNIDCVNDDKHKMHKLT